MTFIKPPPVPREIQEELDALRCASAKVLATKKSARKFLASVRIHVACRAATSKQQVPRRVSGPVLTTKKPARSSVQVHPSHVVACAQP